MRNVENLEHLITNKLSKIDFVATIRSNLVLKQITYKTALPISTSHTIIIRF